jgi:formimidoylglutamate deiminase
MTGSSPQSTSDRPLTSDRAHAGSAAQAGSAPQAAADSSGAERVEGIVVPGMANAHSHAFQRAMAGSSEYKLSARDSFWTWRRAMYALANRIEPDDLQTVATQLFVEMLKAGYTSVAEFHYLHRRPGGVAYSGANALWDAIAMRRRSPASASLFCPLCTRPAISATNH